MASRNVISRLAAGLLFTLPMAASVEAAQSVPGQAASQALSQKRVKALIDQLDQALRKRDIAAYMNLIDPAAEFHVVALVAGAQQAMAAGYDDYRRLLTESLADAKDYQMRRQSLSITLLPDGRALVTDMLLETLKSERKTFKSITSERFLVASRQGQLKVVGLASEQISSSQQ